MKNHQTTSIDKLSLWRESAPTYTFNQLSEDLSHFREWLNQGKGFLDSKEYSTSGERISNLANTLIAEARAKFVQVHGALIYSDLTDHLKNSLRIDELIYLIADNYPGLAPTRQEIFQDSNLKLPDKVGHELSQGLILGELLALPEVGLHLMLSMRKPKSEAVNLLEDFHKNDHIEIGSSVKLIKKDNAGYLMISNLDCLNAEDDELLESMETAVDLILLDPTLKAGVIRGDVMNHIKYQGRRVFCSGINLTQLYNGKLTFLFYITRELGLVSKIFRGLAPMDSSKYESPDRGIEKPWIGVVESHAIGGGCQLLLVMDYVLSEPNAFLSIPARTEGFIPGLANLRLPRFVDHRLAYRMIYGSQRISADSPEGQKLVDEVVEPSQMDRAITRVIEDFTRNGIRGMISNRKAFRHGSEPLDVFRNYMATFSCEQARCMHDPEIIENLQKIWIHRNRKA